MVINITRKGVMGIVEGNSIIIAQKNGGTPTFEQLWASEGEGRKLDIYYREAIGDLERRLTRFLSSSTAQFALTTDGDEGDYTLMLSLGPYWPTRLEGLLGNKVQDFLVHSITAGWLNDFPGVTTKEDYSAMAVADLDDIRYIVEQREFGFQDSTRATDADKEVVDSTTTAEERASDADKEVVDATTTAEERASDADKEVVDSTTTAEERASDADKEVVDATTTAEERATDADKEVVDATTTAEERASDADKEVVDATTTAEERTSDADKEVVDATTTAEERASDADKEIVDATTTAEERASDADKEVVDATTTAEERTRDSYKGQEEGKYLPRGYRRKGDVMKNRMETSARPAAVARKKDNAPVMITHDSIDWSGTHEECMMGADPFGRFETRLNSLNPAWGRPVNGVKRSAHCACKGGREDVKRHDGCQPGPEDRYTPNDDKRWYETLEDMSHERGPEEHRGPDGLYMEKYREQHEQEAMQQHDCGRAMMTELEL